MTIKKNDYGIWYEQGHPANSPQRGTMTLGIGPVLAYDRDHPIDDAMFETMIINRCIALEGKKIEQFKEE